MHPLHPRRTVIAVAFALGVLFSSVPLRAQFSSSTARRVASGASLPATCTSSSIVTDIFIKQSGGSTGLYWCDSTNHWTLVTGSGIGTGDFVGPASSTTNAAVLFADTTGKLGKNSVVTIAADGTVAGVKQLTLTGGVGALPQILTATSTGFEIVDSGGSGSGLVFNLTNFTADRTATWPDASGTVPLLSFANLFTTAQTIQPLTDVITLTLRRNGAAQTSNIVEFQTEANALLSAIDKSGNFSGKAATATALAANGSNCSAGNAPLGVDASGNSEGCFAVLVPSGALGTPSSGTATNLTGTAAGLTAGSATVLATARAINGVNFDGSAAITVPAAGSTLTDTVTVGKGGTGATTLTAHGVVVGAGTSAVAVTSAGTAGQVLTSNGAAADPTFQAASGGTTCSTCTANVLQKGNGAGVLQDSGLTETAAGTLRTAAGVPLDLSTAMQSSDAATVNTMLTGEWAYEQAATNTTGGNAIIGGGMGTRKITITAFASTGSQTVTVTINGTGTTLTEGVDWTCVGTSNNTCASNLATAINANGTLGTKVTATASSAVVGIQRKQGGNMFLLRLATNSGGPITVTNGTDGLPTIYTSATSGVQTALQIISAGSAEKFFTDASNHGLAIGQASTPYIWFNGTVNRVIQSGCFQWSSDNTTAIAGPDVALCRDAAGVLQINGGTSTTKVGVKTIADANGSYSLRTSATEALTLSTSGTTTATSGNLVVAHSSVRYVVYRITTTIATATAFTVSVTGGAALCTEGSATTSQSTLTSGTTGYLVPCSGAPLADWQSATATTLTVSTTGTPSAGVIRLTVIEDQVNAPTS